MTATEVLERSGEMTRLLGAMFGRLQAELLSPLVHRAVAHPAPPRRAARLRGRRPAVELQSRAPLARLQARQDVQNVLLWLDTITRLGPEASGCSTWARRRVGWPPCWACRTSWCASRRPWRRWRQRCNAPGIGRVGA